MTDEKGSDLTPPAEGAPAPQKSQPPKKSVAASQQDAIPPIAPLATPFPSIPAVPGPAPADDWSADDGIELTDEDLASAVGYDETRTLPSVNAKLPSAWIKGPGSVECLVEAVNLLKGAARAAGTPMSEIEAVIVKALPLRQMVLVAPVAKGTSGSIETRHEGHGSIFFNISDILRDAKMQVSSGYKELYPVKKITKSPIGPAVCIYTAKSLETKKIETKKKKS
jgi:hypothetical protein